jgi:hypothetical protein
MTCASIRRRSSAWRPEAHPIPCGQRSGCPQAPPPPQNHDPICRRFWTQLEFGAWRGSTAVSKAGCRDFRGLGEKGPARHRPSPYPTRGRRRSYPAWAGEVSAAPHGGRRGGRLGGLLPLPTPGLEPAIATSGDATAKLHRKASAISILSSRGHLAVCAPEHAMSPSLRPRWQAKQSPPAGPLVR